MQKLLPGIFSYSDANSQEDMILARLLANIKNGFYIDVGACLPTVGSVTKYFYEMKWHGINIEPLPNMFVQICKDRPRDINLNVAIGTEEKQVDFYACGGLSTLSLETATRLSLEQKIEFQKITVPMTTLKTVCEQFVEEREIHFLKIDVETKEKDVLLSHDFNKYLPFVICIESTFPYTMEPLHHEWEHILLKAGYIFTLQHDINRYYVHNFYHQRAINSFNENEFIIVA